MSGNRNIIEETREVIHAASQGDLARRLDARLDSPELRAMAEGINALLESMAGLVHGIESTAAGVSLSAEEISAGNANLSRRTEEQSASLEE
ncbi:MAG: methyl-accepting chemotaxis protein, partial [Solirubrobacteraceae bacterium]